MKEKIVETGIQLFERKGFVETSVQDIVQALNVTKGTFYHYYKTKAELLKDIHLDYINNLLAQQEAIIRQADIDNKTKIIETVRLLIHKIKTDGTSARVFFREMRHLNEADLKMITEKRRCVKHWLQETVEAGMTQGEIRSDLNPNLVTLGILGMCNWSYSWFDPDGQANEDDLITVYVEMILGGLAVLRHVKKEETHV